MNCAGLAKIKISDIKLVTASKLSVKSLAHFFGTTEIVSVNAIQKWDEK